MFSSSSDIFLSRVQSRRKNQFGNHDNIGANPYNVIRAGKKNISLNDTLENSLVELSVDYLTKHHKSIGDSDSINRGCDVGVCVLYSHYKLLHHYKEERYEKLIDLCNRIELQFVARTSRTRQTSRRCA